MRFNSSDWRLEYRVWKNKFREIQSLVKVFGQCARCSQFRNLKVHRQNYDNLVTALMKFQKASCYNIYYTYDVFINICKYQNIFVAWYRGICEKFLSF